MEVGEESSGVLFELRQCEAASRSSVDASGAEDARSERTLDAGARGAKEAILRLSTVTKYFLDPVEQLPALVLLDLLGVLVGQAGRSVGTKGSLVGVGGRLGRAEVFTSAVGVVAGDLDVVAHDVLVGVELQLVGSSTAWQTSNAGVVGVDYLRSRGDRLESRGEPRWGRDFNLGSQELTSESSARVGRRLDVEEEAAWVRGQPVQVEAVAVDVRGAARGGSDLSAGRVGTDPVRVAEEESGLSTLTRSTLCQTNRFIAIQVAPGDVDETNVPADGVLVTVYAEAKMTKGVARSGWADGARNGSSRVCGCEVGWLVLAVVLLLVSLVPVPGGNSECA